MRFEIIGNWNNENDNDNDNDNDGVLFCVQRIEEMLMHYTSHLYKAPVYNSFLLIREYLMVYSSVQDKLADKAHLKNILDEFVDTFNSDIIIKEHIEVKEINNYIGKLMGVSVAEQQKIMLYLFYILKDYPKWCSEALKEIVKKPKEKKKINKTLRSFIPMIIGIGYHPHYIYRECKTIFTEKDINPIDAFETFINIFDGNKKKYTVYFLADKRVNKFKSILQKRLKLSFESDDYSKKIEYDKNKHECVHISVSALDPNGAAHSAFINFDLFMRYYCFLGNRDGKWIEEKCLVKKEDKKCVYPHIGQERFFFPKDFDDKTLGKNSDHIIIRLLENTAKDDFIMIDKVISMHNLAISSQDINSAFLNLWSVMEIIGVDGSVSDTSKIKQIINNIVPVLKRNYVNNIVEEMHDYLKGNLDKNEYDNLINLITEEGTDFYKIACLISLEEFEDTRKKAYLMLTQYPLIRSRISQIYEGIFKKKKKLIVQLNRYGQRIGWHLQRLYRVRNSIIHSGESSDNMMFLVEHLHSYVDEIVLELIKRMTEDENLGTVANVLLDAQFYVEKLEKEFNVDKSINNIDLSFIIR